MDFARNCGGLNSYIIFHSAPDAFIETGLCKPEGYI